MAELCEPTALLYQTVSKFLKGDAPDKLSHLGLSEATMDAYDEDTVKFATETVTRVVATPTLEKGGFDNDTTVQTKAAWKPGDGITVYGAGSFTAITGDLLQIWHRWAKEVLFETNDTVTETIKNQSKKGAA